MTETYRIRMTNIMNTLDKEMWDLIDRGVVREKVDTSDIQSKANVTNVTDNTINGAIRDFLSRTKDERNAQYKEYTFEEAKVLLQRGHWVLPHGQPYDNSEMFTMDNGSVYRGEEKTTFTYMRTLDHTWRIA